MLQELFGKIAGRLRERQQERVDTYRGLVKAIDNGDTVDPENAATILEAVQKTPADLKADVQLIADRRKWRTAWQSEPELLRENNELFAQLEPMRLRHNEELIALRKRQAAESTALNTRLATIADARNKAQEARNKLIESDDRYGTLLEIYDKAGNLIRATQLNVEHSLYRRKQHGEIIVGRLRQQVAAVKREQGDSAGMLLGARGDRADQKLKDLQRQLDNAEGELAFLTDRFDSLLQAGRRHQQEAQKLETEMISA